MVCEPHHYELTILEARLDSFGHVNHTEYLKMFEEARWDIITRNGYGLESVLALGLAPVVLQTDVSYRKELKLREEVRVRTVVTAVRKRLVFLHQQIFNQEGKLCSDAEITIALFDLAKRKMVAPTERFLSAMGVHQLTSF